MLTLVKLEEISGLLLQVPGLVNLQQSRGVEFVGEVKTWLESVESVLKHSNMPVVSKVAAIRGMVVSAEHGVNPEAVSFYGRATLRKMKDAAASAALRAASEIVYNAIQHDISMVGDAERQARQIIVLAKAKELSFLLPNGPDRSQALTKLWRTLATDPDIGPGTVNIESLVGQHDAFVILDRAIATETRNEF
jgi:hypothetical protein